jgi:hypothetical protein
MFNDETSQFECLPDQVLPPRINVNEYNINFDGTENKITSIRHTNFGPVKFNAYMLDQECGYVQGSKMVLYTALYKDELDMLNVIHAHINDTSD